MSSNRPTKYKAAEVFYSVKGEGIYTGVPMLFCRLSQCPVGGVEGICTGWDGTKFVCDTGRSYGAAHRAEKGGPEWHSYNEVRWEGTAADIWAKASQHNCKHIVLTGGEPLIYDLEPFVKAMPYGAMIHIETSGTEDQSQLLRQYRQMFWTVVSPKVGCKKAMLDVADEVKFLVDSRTTMTQLQDYLVEMELTPQPLYTQRWLLLQAIEDSNNLVWQHNIQTAIGLALQKPSWFRVSTQVHKYLQVR